MSLKKSLIIISLILALGLASVGGALLMNHDSNSADCILAANQNFNCDNNLMPSSASHIKMFDALSQAIFASPLINILFIIFLILAWALFSLPLFNLTATRPLGFVFSQNLAHPRDPAYLHWLALLENSPSSS